MTGGNTRSGFDPEQMADEEDDKQKAVAHVAAERRHAVTERRLGRLRLVRRLIHGDKSQNARQTALNRFRSGECRVLVATDIAARGIDVIGLSHVFNYDMPVEPEAYIHRIGRTGRAGRAGKAVSFCCIDEVKQLNQVEKLIGKRLRQEQSDWPMEVTTPTPPRIRDPRPAKVNRNGEAMPARHAAGVPQTASARPVRRRQADKVTIGRDGKIRSATGTGQPVHRVNRRKRRS